MAQVGCKNKIEIILANKTHTNHTIMLWKIKKENVVDYSKFENIGQSHYYNSIFEVQGNSPCYT